MRVYENLVGTVHVVRTVLVLLEGMYSTGLEQTSIALAKTVRYSMVKCQYGIAWYVVVRYDTVRYLYGTVT